MMQDEQIIELYFLRDENALNETSDKYGNYCRTIARNIVHDEETVNECFNDTLFHSWNAMPPQRPNCLKAFLGRITRNISLKRITALTALKRGGGEVVLALDELGECVSDSAAYSAEQFEEDMVIHETLKTFLAGLPAQTRRIFVRRYWYCSSIQEIATAMALSEGNVKTILSRGRSKLKALLEKAGITV
jgi:RNA polymerase sigma-70 factor (ECF subfamily)